MKNVRSLFVMLALATVFNACKQDDPPLPDNLVQFEAAEQGFESDKADTEVKLTLTRAAEANTVITVDLAPTGIAYGTQFSTAPAATNNSLTVTIPAGSSTGSFKVTKGANLFLNGTESIRFSIKSAASPVLVGEKKALTLKFSSIVSAGSQMKLEGGEGGASAVNSVFVDFSNNLQKAVARASWDLGFYNGTDFRVIINGTTGATAQELTKTDLSQVTPADTAGLRNVLILSQGTGSFENVDDVDGDLTKTVIKAISATDAENKVYIINPGTSGAASRPWYKVRIIRKGTGYTLQYAQIAETTFKTLDISKDANLNFSYVSFEKGLTEVEPAKANWDIEWTLATYKATLSATASVPYTYADYVFINHLAGVEAAEVLTSTVAYDAYAESNVATTPFKKDRNLIGSNWRTSAGPNGVPAGVRTDRFYVIKDAAGNVYKLKFLNYTASDGGLRGYPNIEYKLVKKA
ncbi:heme-binding HmuY-like protein [Larkinella arboricola]|uniref:Heme-binding HmuY-like protein n=1 Tax=Larkinella arboricola TaxID=643671 RepID=A0A327X7Z7_LARAB|nr:HmuY family protein [Larkinella arboricola]RAK03260.1 heme-binding HmuY-like protein [Larkinella arboricola]